MYNKVKLYFSETNNITDTHDECESESCESQQCQLNKNLDATSFSEKLKHSKPKLQQIRQQRWKCGLGTVPLIVSGSILLTLGLLSTKFTFTDLILAERIKMRPWFPTYDLWLNPRPEIRLNVYIFTVENANEFLNGVDSKMKIKEIGPIVYREHLRHLDVVHHDNSTLSYSALRWAEFLPDANKPGILNETITVPNFAVLAAASFVNEHNYFVHVGYNFLHRRYNHGLFINITVHDYLWNYKSKLLQRAQELVPSMVPYTNIGVLHTVYDGGADRYNVKIGTKYGDSQFFQITTVNGAPTVPGYDIRKGDCYASVENSTEGVMYRQCLTNLTWLTVWRKALCRTVDLHFEKEVLIDGILSYKYTLGPDMYDRKPNNETDCYKGAYGELQNGLSDISKCYFDVPFAASVPHFYGRSEGFTKKFEGLNASEESHSCFVIVEPKTGAPVIQAARSQMNLVIPKFSSFFDKEYQAFSDMVLPLFWVECLQNGLTPEIRLLVGVIVNILPIIEVTLTCLLFLVGFALLLTAFVKLFHSTWKDSTKSEQINFRFVQRRTSTGSNCDNLK